MTVHEFELAQALTSKPMKGMLTGGHSPCLAERVKERAGKAAVEATWR
jgi:methionine synthase II (cobalamin-independent)